MKTILIFSEYYLFYNVSSFLNRFREEVRYDMTFSIIFCFVYSNSFLYFMCIFGVMCFLFSLGGVSFFISGFLLIL